MHLLIFWLSTHRLSTSCLDCLWQKRRTEYNLVRDNETSCFQGPNSCEFSVNIASLAADSLAVTSSTFKTIQISRYLPTKSKWICPIWHLEVVGKRLHLRRLAAPLGPSLHNPLTNRPSFIDRVSGSVPQTSPLSCRNSPDVRQVAAALLCITKTRERAQGYRRLDQSTRGSYTPFSQKKHFFT
jgi:hypothetical protein